MTALKNHPDKWLRSDAAASIDRLEATHGTIGINSAGRTEAEQQEFIHRYFDIGGPANRPPNLYAPARPASASNHVKNGGLAIDTNNISHMLKYGPEFGWFQNFAYDPVHFEYDPTRDKHAGGSDDHSDGNATLKAEQNFLNVARGEKLVVDGKKGSLTTAAIKRYQTFLKKYGYKGAIDGVWGKDTQSAHSGYYADWKKQGSSLSPEGRSTIKMGSTGFKVEELQRKLNAHYPAYSKLTVDGKFGQATQNVVKEFQRRSGLTADGIVGPKTWAKLGM